METNPSPYTNSQDKQWNDTHSVPEKAPADSRAARMDCGTVHWKPQR